MTVTSNFGVDTNILIYSLDRSEPVKQLVADKLIRAVLSKRAPLPLQCLNEFYRATTRKHLLTTAEANAFVNDVLKFIVPVSSVSEDLIYAMQLHATNNIQFFDALIIATATRAGCIILFSEDLQNGRSFGPLTIRNPFLMADSELDTILA
jgi:predicted nucleic acid-binding protein